MGPGLEVADLEAEADGAALVAEAEGAVGAEDIALEEDPRAAEDLHVEGGAPGVEAEAEVEGDAEAIG